MQLSHYFCYISLVITYFYAGSTLNTKLVNILNQPKYTSRPTPVYTYSIHWRCILCIHIQCVTRPGHQDKVQCPLSPSRPLRT